MRRKLVGMPQNKSSDAGDGDVKLPGRLCPKSGERCFYRATRRPECSPAFQGRDQVGQTFPRRVSDAMKGKKPKDFFKSSRRPFGVFATFEAKPTGRIHHLPRAARVGTSVRSRF